MRRADVDPVAPDFVLQMGDRVRVTAPADRMADVGQFLGAAAGTLLTGLVFGRLGRIGPVVKSMSKRGRTVASYVGMIAFLAYAGTRAGERIAEASSPDVG